jgi:hypothetical protein
MIHAVLAHGGLSIISRNSAGKVLEFLPVHARERPGLQDATTSVKYEISDQNGTIGTLPKSAVLAPARPELERLRRPGGGAAGARGDRPGIATEESLARLYSTARGRAGCSEHRREAQAGAARADQEGVPGGLRRPAERLQDDRPRRGHEVHADVAVAGGQPDARVAQAPDRGNLPGPPGVPADDRLRRQDVDVRLRRAVLHGARHALADAVDRAVRAGPRGRAASPRTSRTPGSSRSSAWRPAPRRREEPRGILRLRHRERLDDAERGAQARGLRSAGWPRRAARAAEHGDEERRERRSRGDGRRPEDARQGDRRRAGDPISRGEDRPRALAAEREPPQEGERPDR